MVATGAVAVKIVIAPDVFGPNGKGYQNDSADQDMANIGIDIIKTDKSAKKCEIGKLVKAKYRGYTAEGQVVTDTAQEDFINESRTFPLGADNLWKCFDLAIPQLSQGDRVKLSCPSYLAFGQKDQTSPLTGETIPGGTDITFDLDILGCNGLVTKAEMDPKKNLQPRSTTMQPDTCMYLQLIESENTGMDLVLSSQAQDASEQWPGKWAMFEEKVVDDEAQQWFYNAEKGTLHNAANPDYTLDIHEGWLYLANVNSKSAAKDKQYPKKARKWFFEDATSALTTTKDGIKMQVALWGQPKQWAWAQVLNSEEARDSSGAKLHIDYCYQR